MAKNIKDQSKALALTRLSIGMDKPTQWRKKDKLIEQKDEMTDLIDLSHNSATTVFVLFNFNWWI